jgi:hypothetical protein
MWRPSSKACKNLFYTSFPIKRDDGRIEVVHAWRADADTRPLAR